MDITTRTIRDIIADTDMPGTTRQQREKLFDDWLTSHGFTPEPTPVPPTGCDYRTIDDPRPAHTADDVEALAFLHDDATERRTYLEDTLRDTSYGYRAERELRLAANSLDVALAHLRDALDALGREPAYTGEADTDER